MSRGEDPDVAWARAVLGVGPWAGSRAIQRAFRARCKETHPDRGGETREFEDVHLAHRILRGVESGLAQGWVVSDWAADEVRPRVAAEQPRRRPRTSFQQAFHDAMRRQTALGRKAHDGSPSAD